MMNKNNRVVIWYLLLPTVMLICIIVLAGCMPMKNTAKLTGDDPIAQAKIESMQAEMNGIKEAIANITTSIQAQIAASITAQVKAQADAKINSDTSTLTAGHDITQNNDTGLMKQVMHYWWLIFCALIGLMKWQSARDDKKNKELIRILEASKQDYKERFLSVGIKNTDELKAFKEEHEKLKQVVCKKK